MLPAVLARLVQLSVSQRQLIQHQIAAMHCFEYFKPLSVGICCLFAGYGRPVLGSSKTSANDRDEGREPTSTYLDFGARRSE